MRPGHNKTRIRDAEGHSSTARAEAGSTSCIGGLRQASLALDSLSLLVRQADSDLALEALGRSAVYPPFSAPAAELGRREQWGNSLCHSGEGVVSVPACLPA